jgi:putative tryptophan/tyrosine transport system substrate-binding protein
MEKTIWIHSLFGLNSKSKTPAIDLVTASSDFSRGIQNRKLSGIFALALILAMCGTVAHAQQSKIPHIGWLGAGPASIPGGGSELFLRELGRLGYVDGKNVAIEYRYATNKLDWLPQLADELVRLKVDLLVTAGPNAALAAKNATKTIPVVFLNVSSDPVRVGLVESMARPGGNITGFTTIAEVLSGKRLELLKETIPKLPRVAVLWNPRRGPGASQQWKENQLAARELDLQLHSMEVASADKLEAAFKEAVKAGSAALSTTASSFINAHQKRLAELAAKYRLPAIYDREDFVAKGGLMSYGTDQTDSYRRAALMVDKILKGAKPSDLPVEQPTKFQFIINLKTAKQIGLIIPPSVLGRADKVIR